MRIVILIHKLVNNSTSICNNIQLRFHHDDMEKNVGKTTNGAKKKKINEIKRQRTIFHEKLRYFKLIILQLMRN